MKKIVIEIPVDGIYCDGCQMITHVANGEWCSAFMDHLSVNYSGKHTVRCNECLCAKHYEECDQIDIVGQGVYWYWGV